METKICVTCHRELPVENFWRNKNRVDGLQSSCKECHYEAVKASKERKKKVLVEAEVIPPPDAAIYNLIEIEKQTIIRCITDNPQLSFGKYAELLGISERTLYRKINIYDLKDFISDNRSFSEREMADAISGINLVKAKTLSDYDDREILEELWRRDYDGNIWKMVKKETTISKLFGKRKC